VSPLRKAEDARIIDNTHLSYDEQLALAVKMADEVIKNQL
jgi:cytidylate kinase